MTNIRAITLCSPDTPIGEVAAALIDAASKKAEDDGQKVLASTARFFQVDDVPMFMNMADVGADYQWWAVEAQTRPANGLPASADLDLPIESLTGLSVRPYNGLKRAGVHRVKDLQERSMDDLLDIRNFGKKSVDELDAALRNTLGVGLNELLRPGEWD